jgi:A/G-specific adenine glycosylase
MAVRLPGDDWKLKFRRRLLAWFRDAHRDLPWRRTHDPYAIWVSEIMLQQTQVATVIAYYERFLAAFPTVVDLAAADEQQVLRLWEGLGYYRRARQLHQAARKIVAEHGGQFPREPAQIRELPGIGRYTAGAIASIAWNAREPILEANTIRLLSRLLGYRGDPSRSAGQRLLWRFAEELLPRREAGTFNQALMELGSVICTPRDPLCADCPVATLCPTRERGLQASVPAAKKKTAYLEVTEAAVVVRRDGRVLVRRCGEEERWSGLWDFPRVPVCHPPGKKRAAEITLQVAALTGHEIQLGWHFATIKHGVTRFRITLDCYEASCLGGQADGQNVRWVTRQELEHLPLSTTGREISRLVAQTDQMGIGTSWGTAPGFSSS